MVRLSRRRGARRSSQDTTRRLKLFQGSDGCLGLIGPPLLFKLHANNYQARVEKSTATTFCCFFGRSNLKMSPADKPPPPDSLLATNSTSKSLVPLLKWTKCYPHSHIETIRRQVINKCWRGSRLSLEDSAKRINIEHVRRQMVPRRCPLVSSTRRA